MIMTPNDLALHTDFYQLTMAASYFAQGMDRKAVFGLTVRGLPPRRGYLVAAGLEAVLDYLEGFRFSEAQIAYLGSLGRFQPEFLDYLAKLKFTGAVRAMPEGSVCFAGEPLLEVSGPIIEAQLVETFIINTINLNTMLASKAARCALAAKGRTCVDFSLRRTHGLSAGLAVARSSAIAGFAGTSNVAAAAWLGTVPVGTMAHSFVEAFGDEEAAFEAFAQSFPGMCVLLVDTYDTATGLKRAVKVAKNLAAKGRRLAGVRLDSGDLARLSQEARRLLDANGLTDAKVVISGSLDELSIAKLLDQGAMVDILGIGTKMGSSADAPYLDLAYKLVSYDGRPTLKLSIGKESWVSAKQVWRELGPDGTIKSEVLGLASEERPGRALVAPVMEGGRRLGPEGGWRAARERFQDEIKTLPAACLELGSPQPLTPSISPALQERQDQARQRALGT